MSHPIRTHRLMPWWHKYAMLIPMYRRLVLRRCLRKIEEIAQRSNPAMARFLRTVVNAENLRHLSVVDRVTEYHDPDGWHRVEIDGPGSGTSVGVPETEEARRIESGVSPDVWYSLHVPHDPKLLPVVLDPPGDGKDYTV